MGVAGWGDAVGTVGCERLPLPLLPLEDFSWGGKLRNYPQRLVRWHVGLFDNGSYLDVVNLVWML